MTWYYRDQVFTGLDAEGYVGFVYLIENIQSGKKYIGKKLFKFTKTKVVKGKKKKVKSTSDWEDYYGSNNMLNEDVKTYGKHNFKRTIIHLCKSKGTANYLEMKEQILNNVLESNDWYNDQIRVRVHRSHIRL